MLARSGPTRGDYAFEVKWDGFRAIVRRGRGCVCGTPLAPCELVFQLGNAQPQLDVALTGRSSASKSRTKAEQNSVRLVASCLEKAHTDTAVTGRSLTRRWSKWDRASSVRAQGREADQPSDVGVRTR